MNWKGDNEQSIGKDLEVGGLAYLGVHSWCMLKETEGNHSDLM
jgi:hypothetical protein